jgi:hypothetical protein
MVSTLFAKWNFQMIAAIDERILRPVALASNSVLKACPQPAGRRAEAQPCLRCPKITPGQATLALVAMQR